MNETTTREVTYRDPQTGCMVTKTVDVPPLAKVTDLGQAAVANGDLAAGDGTAQMVDLASQTQFGGAKALAALFSLSTRIGDLATPLAAASRQVLAEELKTALGSPDEQQAIDALAGSWQPTDDVMLKVLGRLTAGIERQRQKRGKNVAKRQQLLHDKALLDERNANLQRENAALHIDVAKVVSERDALKRRQAASHTNVKSQAQKDVARADKRATKLDRALKQERDDHRCTQVKLHQTETALVDVRASAHRENVAAIDAYESATLSKLTSVAAEHNALAEEAAKLRLENSNLKGERNVLRSQVDAAHGQIRHLHNNAQVKERDMSETEQDTTTEVAEEILACGDTVHCKISGDGPYVLVTQVEEGVVKYANPIPGTKNHFNSGEVRVTNPWLVRDRGGNMQCFPGAILTKTAPKSSFSFGGVKSMVTSPVTGKLFQAAVWVAMLTLLYMRG